MQQLVVVLFYRFYLDLSVRTEMVYSVFPHGEIEKGCSMFSVPASCPTIIQLLLIIRVLLAVT